MAGKLGRPSRAALVLLLALVGCGGLPQGDIDVLFESTEQLAKTPKNPDPSRGCVLDPDPPPLASCGDMGCIKVPACQGAGLAWLCSGDPETPLAQATCTSAVSVAGGGTVWCCPFVSAAAP